jgi:uncharacterized protein (DUF58 family)
LAERLFDEAFLRQLERLAIIFRTAANSQMQGERRSKRRGQSVEFADFRPYTLGDDFRRVDWNAYARLERLFLKLFIEEEEIIVYLLIDNSRSMDWGEPNKLRYALRAAAAIGYITLVGLDRVSASPLFVKNHSNASYFPPLRGKDSAVRLFDFIQAISVEPGHDALESRFASIASNIPRPGSFIILSDLMQDVWQPAVNLLLGHGHEISILHVLSPDEIAPELNGDYRLVDSETESEIEITADYETIQSYQRHRADWQGSWRKFCAARGVGYAPVSTDLLLEDLLFASLPKVGVLR